MIDNKLYGAFDFSISAINSLHISGKKDPLYQMTRKEPICYLNGHKSMFEHEEGHKVPKKFTPEQFELFDNLLRREFISKYGSDGGFILHKISLE